MGRTKKMTRMMKNAESAILEVFDKSPQAIFREKDLEEILDRKRADWQLADRTRISDFVQFLLESSNMKSVRVEFPSRPLLRYTWGEVSIYKVVQSLKEGSYFSHQTAMYLHELSEQIPEVIYLNIEQTPKPPSSTSLSQSGIDRAFKGKPRMSNNMALYGNFSIRILNGKFTRNLGVLEVEMANGEKVPATGLERTLIDIAVRPFYAGGVFDVLKAVQKAGGKVSVTKLMAILKKLDYAYPYHQVIGFYLEKSGAYNDSAIKLFRKPGIKFDFYLTYGMKQMEFSEEWRVYYPKGL